MINTGPLTDKKAYRKEIIILILCIVIGFALRFYSFSHKSLWMDEVYTLNDSRDDLKGQIIFYKENPNFSHPPLFFVLTHLFYPFEKPERDLRIIPLVAGTLSIPMIYFYAKSFSPYIALPCAISLTFMAYHTGLSQDGRSYSLLMLISMAGLYWFMVHLKTLNRRYLIIVSFFYSVLFYTSYSSILFITFSQILWFYRAGTPKNRFPLSSFLILNALILLLCLPWIIFLIHSYRGQPIGEEFRYIKQITSFWSIIYGIFNDWTPYAPLMLFSLILLILFPFISKDKINAIILLSTLVFSVAGLYLFCGLLSFSHFITSRYLIGFLPLFLVSIYLSLHAVEAKIDRFKKYLRLEYLFITLFVISNLIIFPLYYQSEKQDFRGLVNYLKKEIEDGDLVSLSTIAQFPGVLYYFGVVPRKRHYDIPCQKFSEDDIECGVSLINGNNKFIISYSKRYWHQYALRGKRLWRVVNKAKAEKEMNNPFCSLKGYFDGSVLNYDKFPTDDSMYLILCDSSSFNQKGIDMPFE